MRFLKNKLLAILVTPLLILLIAGSFYRFVILRDYMVKYEIECNPAEESCYVYCEDEACSEPSYYAYMEKYAAAVYEQCGPDITECETADICLPEEGDQCTIMYCDPTTEECSDSATSIKNETEGGSAATENPESRLNTFDNNDLEL